MKSSDFKINFKTMFQLVKDIFVNIGAFGLPALGVFIIFISSLVGDLLLPNSGFMFHSSIYPFKYYEKNERDKMVLDIGSNISGNLNLSLLWAVKSDGKDKIDFDSKFKLAIKDGSTNFELHEIKPDTGGFESIIEDKYKRIIIKNGLYRRKITNGKFAGGDIFLLNIERESNSEIIDSTLNELWDKKSGLKYFPFRFSNDREVLPQLIIDTPFENSWDLAGFLFLGFFAGILLTVGFYTRKKINFNSS